MEDFEETLRNIDTFCRILVKKIAEEEDCSKNITVEPIENLLRRKYVKEEDLERTPLANHLIPLPKAEEPLVDVFEDDDYVRIFLQYRCKDQKATIHTDVDGLERCTKDRQKLKQPVKHLQIENVIVTCNGNNVLEINIPKTTATRSYGK
ncbi:hypothetical protein KAU92_02595 [Candidatus Bathyarchaeota archaeon]|nr:hypothetical protein [Candidatus Bathyarchaeota archaeon]